MAPVKRRGYTLTEMVVVFFLVASMAAAIGAGTVTLLRDTTSRQAESAIQRVLIAEQSFARRHGGYTAFPDEISVAKVSIVASPSDAPDAVSAALGVEGSLGLAVRRSDEVCVLLQAGSLDSGRGVKSWTSARSSCDGSDALPLDEAEDPEARSTPRALS